MSVPIEVDGATVSFVVIGDDQSWAAYSTIERRNVRLNSRHFPIDRVVLAAVDPEIDYELPKELKS